MGAGEVHLVEADQRKAAFLREAARVTGTDVTVLPERLERVTPFPVDVVTARAFAPLARLLPQARRFPPRQPGRPLCCLFPKGADVDEELTALGKQGKLNLVHHRSCTNPHSTILSINLDVEDADEAIPR